MQVLGTRVECSVWISSKPAKPRTLNLTPLQAAGFGTTTGPLEMWFQVCRDLCLHVPFFCLPALHPKAQTQHTYRSIYLYLNMRAMQLCRTMGMPPYPSAN